MLATRGPAHPSFERARSSIGTRRKPATWWQWITVTACNDNHTKTAGYRYTDNNSDADKFAAAKAQVAKKEAPHHQADVFSREKKREEDGRRSFVFLLVFRSLFWRFRTPAPQPAVCRWVIIQFRLAASRIRFHSRAAYIYLHTRCTATHGLHVPSSRKRFARGSGLTCCNPP